VPKKSLIDEQDVRAMVRLLGEVAANAGDHAVKKRQLMEGLCRLIGADSWMWGMCASLEPGMPPVYVMGYTGGFEPHHVANIMKSVESQEMRTATAHFARELAEKRTHLTRLQEQIDPDGYFQKKPLSDWAREAGIGAILNSYRPLEGGIISAICLYRRPDRPFFGSRDARIAHIVLSEVAWLHLLGWPTKDLAALPNLAPRQWTVFNLLVMGHSRGEVASSLNLSQHTVNGYVKAIFLHFNVHSRTQLVSRFLQGDGGDSP
jgi:DNA-binding CsgD family transcriptional regulator